MNRLVAAGLVSLFLVSCASKPPAAATPAADPSRYTAEPGTIPVGVIPEASLRDAQRDRTLAMAVDYPTRGGANPVILFSHGLGSAPRDYISFASYWASHGFVVIRIAHADARRAGEEVADSEQLESGEALRADSVLCLLLRHSTHERQHPALRSRVRRHARASTAVEHRGGAEVDDCASPGAEQR